MLPIAPRSARQLSISISRLCRRRLAVGEPHAMTCEMTAEVTALLPKDAGYLMGVGRPEQLADYVALGIDMMDCVLPRAPRATPPLHQRRPRAHQERALRPGSAAHRPQVHLLRLPPLLARLSSSSLRRGRNHRGDSRTHHNVTFTLT